MAVPDENDAAWVVEGNFDQLAFGHSHSLFSLANGILGVRGGPAELADGHGTIIGGAFVQLPLTYHERFPGYADSTDTRLSGPGVTAIEVELDGEVIDFAAATLAHHHARLDLRSAIVEIVSRWTLADGRQLDIRSERFVPIGAAAMVSQRISVTPLNFGASIRIGFAVGMIADQATTAADPRIAARASFRQVECSPESECWVSAFTSGVDGGPVLSIRQVISSKQSDLVVEDHAAVHGTREQGQPLIAERTAVLALGGLGGKPLDQAVGDFDSVVVRHRTAIAQFWRSANISVPDDPELQRAIRFNLLQIFMSASRTPDFATAAKGLSGVGYEGHAFWDNDVFVLPVLATIVPELARVGIDYRIAQLDHARAHARAIGHPRGALFPWRTIAGTECSAHYPTGSAQYHVNAAVAYALEIYLNATGDESVLAEGGCELLVETARLWFDLGHFSERRGGAFLIHGVTGPDEYTALVDNDFYTNAMARRHLNFAASAIEKLATADPAAHRELTLALRLDASELADWRRAAKQMWLPVDRELGIHPQDDTFLDKPLFPGLPDDGEGHRPLLMRVHPMVLYRHRLTKQGDVLQAHVTAGLEDSMAQIGRDFAYYEPLTTHDSTLSMSAFAICAAWIGDAKRAMRYWRETAHVDLGNLHGNTDHGLHMAAMAGSWLILAQGWAGLGFQDETLRLTPHCPPGWTSYSFRLKWHGSSIEVTVTPERAVYRLLGGPALTLLDHGRPIYLSTEPRSVDSPVIKAVIFDLDGVLTDTAEAHYHAWKQLADEHAIPFSREVNEGLKGVDRPNSLRRILESAGVTVDDKTFDAMLARKNALYQERIADFSPADLFDGAGPLLRDCRRAGLKIGLASASRNAASLVEKLGIARWLDHVADPAKVAHGKPAPDIFLATAKAVGVPPENCVGIEDAMVGITAIRKAGMTAFGIGNEIILSEAHKVFPDVGSINLREFSDILPEVVS